MRVHVIGGGPAGLYLSILLKAADPGHQIRIWERNAADNTFGWGVVFSDETLGNLEAADPETYRSIIEAFTYWDSIDIHFKGERIRSEGHGFCGMSRQTLLNILRDRALSLGIEINYNTEVDDIEGLRDCDLLVGADGINSKVRALYADRFVPSSDGRKCRFMWLGTKQSFEAFTFSFKKSEHGIFQIHAYQFEEGTSTVIVECHEDTWKAAGLDTASTSESIAYCEKLFAEELDGHDLIDNNTCWRQFPTIKNEHWHFDNVVLIGDAVHTAHFSVGSGTKLAMEDAIALAEALSTQGTMAEALTSYEEAHRSWVGRIQKSAQQSLEWFETVDRYWDFEPLPFVISLLTRSRRITHDNLKLRDPNLIEQADRWYLEHVGQRVPAEDVAPTPPMFTPFTLRDMTLSNRVVVSPMCQYSAVDGVPSDWHLVHLGSRAMGGAGLVFAEMTDVSAEGRISPGCTGLWNEEQEQAWKRVVDFVHSNTQSKIGLQLGHAGRKASCKVLWEGYDEPLETGGWETIAPSAVAYKSGSPVPRAMDRADMDRVRDEFVAAAKRADAAGFDILELHCAHGYLLSSFLTPLSNQREDEYGGTLENRMRYPLEVFDAVRAVWSEQKPMSVRVSATDWVAGGFDGDDAVVLAKELKDRGCDIIDVSTGQTSTEAKPIYGRCYQTPFADQIRNEAGIATLTVGNITSADQINTILLAGRSDLCALARPHLKQPYFTMAAAESQEYFDFPYPKQYIAARSRRS